MFFFPPACQMNTTLKSGQSKRFRRTSDLGGKSIFLWTVRDEGVADSHQRGQDVAGKSTSDPRDVLC